MGKKKVGGGPGITAGGDVNIGDITSSQVAIGKNITQTLTLSTTDKEELLKNLKEFQKEIAKLRLPEDQHSIVLGDVTATITEAEKEEPDPSKIKYRFQGAIDTMKEVGGVIEKVTMSETCKKILSILGKLGLSFLL